MNTAEEFLKTFLDKHPELSKDELQARLSKSGNVVISSRYNSGIEGVYHLDGRCVGGNIESFISNKQLRAKEKIAFLKNIKKCWNNFKETNLLPEMKEGEIDFYLGEDSLDSNYYVTVICSNGNIKEKGKKVPALLFDDVLLSTLEKRIEREVLKTKTAQLQTVKCRRSKDKRTLYVDYVPKNKFLYKSGTFKFERNNIIDDNVINQIMSCLRKNENLEMKPDIEESLIASLKKFRYDKLKQFGGEEKYLELLNSPLGEMFLKEYHSDLLYKTCNINFGKLVVNVKQNDTVLHFSYDNYKITYDAKNKKINGITHKNEVFWDKCKIVQKNYSKFEHAVNIVKKDFPKASFYINDGTIIHWKDSYLSFDFDNCIDVSEKNYISQIKNLNKTTKTELIERNKKELAAVSEKYGFGEILPVVIARLVKANEKFITPNVVVKMLRGLRFGNSYHYNKTPDCGKFSEISNDEILYIIRRMINSNLLESRIGTWDYGDYEAISLGNKMETFMNMSENEPVLKTKNFENNTEYSVLNTLNNKPEIADNMSETTLGKNLLWLAEHPAIYCLNKNAVEKFAEKAPKKYKEFLKTAAGFEEVPSTKRFKKMLATI